jgi:NAD(P)H-nitrite reductase large subunit
VNYVIIGNSYAGIACVEAIREVDERGEITIISNEPYRAYSRPLISYYLAGKVTEEEMYYRQDDFYKKFGISTLFGREVVKIDVKEKRVLLDEYQQVEYDKILIATGGKPFIPELKGLDAEGVFTFTNFDDAKGIKMRSKRHKKAVIVGGGLIGLKAAEGLNAIGVDVTIVELGPRILPLALDEVSGEIVNQRLNDNNIKTVTSHTIREILEDDDGEVRGVVLDDGQEIMCGILIIAIGVRPNIDMLEGSGIKTNHGVLVDQFMQTSVEDIYAAGDVVEGYDLVNERNSVIAIVPLAYEQGRVAGFNMAGRRRRYYGGMAMNSVEIYGLPVMTMGLTSPKDDTLEVLRFHRGSVYRSFVLDRNRLIGAILVGEVDYGGVITGIIKRKENVSEIKDILIQGDYLSLYNLT